MDRNLFALSRRSRFWAARLAILVLMAVVIALAYSLSRPVQERNRLDLLVHEAFSEVPWHYRWISGNRAWLPKFLVEKAMQEDIRIGTKVANAEEELVSLGRAAWPSVPGLLKRLQDNDIGIRLTAGRLLGRIKANESPVFENLTASLANEKRPAEAFHWLLKFGRPLAVLLIDDFFSSVWRRQGQPQNWPSRI